MPRPNFDEIALITRDLNYAYLQGYKRLISRDELLNLKGGGDLKLYETVAQDDQVKSCVQQRISAVISRDWGVEPGGEGKRDKAAAEFVEAELKNLQWDKICEKMLWGTFYGYSVGEIMWRRGDLIGIEGIKVRDRRRFNFGVDLEPKLITIEDPMGEDLPTQKFWHFSCGGDNDDDPYGRGLAHWLYWPTFFKRSDMRWWVTFLEKYAQPSRLGKYQPGATENDKETLWQAMDAFGSNGKMLIPEGTAIELLEASRAGGADYQALLDTCNGAISKIILSQTMTTDDGSSQSQANVHQDVKDDVVKADADLICSSFNNGPIKWLTDWNFPGAAYPRVWRQMDSEPDLMVEAERDSKLQGLGISLKPESIAGKYGEDYFVPERENPSLAGEQVTALISIVSGATQGGWSPELVRGLIASSFPTMSDEAIAAITDNLGGESSAPLTERSRSGADAGEPADLDSVAAQFAAAKGKKKNCKAGISCGNACISASKICRKDLTDGQKKAKVPIVAAATSVAPKVASKPKPQVDSQKESIPVPVDLVKAEKKVFDELSDLNKNIGTSSGTLLSQALFSYDFEMAITQSEAIYAQAQALASVADKGKSKSEDLFSEGIAAGNGIPDDWILKSISKDLGYDKLPDVVEEKDIDRSLDSDSFEFYRGVGSNKNRFQVHFSNFKEGDLYAGHGVYGHGTYVASIPPVTKKEAITVAKSYGSGVMRMAFKGKMIEDSKLTSEMIDFDQKIDNWQGQKLIKVLSNDSQLKPKIDTIINEVDKYKESATGKNDDGSYFPRISIPPTGNQKRGYSRDFYDIKVIESKSNTSKSSWRLGDTEYTSKKEAMQAAVVVAKTRIKRDAVKDIAVGNNDALELQKSVDKLKTVLFGDSISMHNGISGRFAALKGYDGINLLHAYDKNFAILLNRGKVKVQKDNVLKTRG